MRRRTAYLSVLAVALCLFAALFFRSQKASEPLTLDNSFEELYEQLQAEPQYSGSYQQTVFYQYRYSEDDSRLEGVFYFLEPGGPLPADTGPEKALVKGVFAARGENLSVIDDGGTVRYRDFCLRLEQENLPLQGLRLHCLGADFPLDPQEGSVSLSLGLERSYQNRQDWPGGLSLTGQVEDQGQLWDFHINF